jgi:hypothetical protein
VAIDFPKSVTFSARVEAASGIAEVALEYGADMLTCGDVIARAYPPFQPGPASQVSWTWDMDASGSQPPGAPLWYRWRVTDTAGAVHTGETQRITWLDDQHPWQATGRGPLTLHYYEGDAEFAEDLLATAERSLARLSQETGVTARAPIGIYIYADSQAMRESLLYAPGWAGGVAFPEHSLVAIGIHPMDIDWGRRSIAHEISHVLVGHRTFSCLGALPTWLNEGLAVYGEGGPETSEARRFEAAVEDDELLPVRALSAGFSADPEEAGLSYTQSYSLVRFLIETYGRAKLLGLLDDMSRGATVDAALQRTYGFDVEGLEERWRAAIGARPLPPSDTDSAAPSAPTAVPTYQPVLPPQPAAAEATPAPVEATPSAPPVAAADTPAAAVGTPVAAADTPATEPAPPPAPLALAAPPAPPDPLKVGLGIALLVVALPLGFGAGVGVLLLGTRRR